MRLSNWDEVPSADAITNHRLSKAKDLWPGCRQLIDKIGEEYRGECRTGKPVRKAVSTSLRGKNDSTILVSPPVDVSTLIQDDGAVLILAVDILLIPGIYPVAEALELRSGGFIDREMDIVQVRIPDFPSP